MERIESSSTSSSCVPPGFRFHPTEEELVGYYLRKKIASQKIDLDVIKDIDLYRIEPWDLQEKCRIGYEEEKEWYFFSHKDKKYPTGTRTNRATLAGFWKATGRDKAVYDNKTTKLIGMRKTLVFYKGRAPNGQKSDWIIHEYRLESEENAPPQEEGWVVCRAFKKRPSAQAKNTEAWDASNFYDEPMHITHHHQNPNFPPHNLTCKQEFYESENFNNFITNNPDPIFLQLPKLDSPSLPLPKSQISKSSISNNNAFEAAQVENNNNNKNVTHDWRDLDKFVAYQLSQGDDAVISSFVDDSDLGFLLPQNNKELFFSSDADCDIGICVFDK